MRTTAAPYLPQSGRPRIGDHPKRSPRSRLSPSRRPPGARCPAHGPTHLFRSVEPAARTRVAPRTQSSPTIASTSASRRRSRPTMSRSGNSPAAGRTPHNGPRRAQPSAMEPAARSAYRQRSACGQTDGPLGARAGPAPTGRQCQRICEILRTVCASRVEAPLRRVDAGAQYFDDPFAVPAN